MKKNKIKLDSNHENHSIALVFIQHSYIQDTWAYKY
jgi:hypothetical protein